MTTSTTMLPLGLTELPDGAIQCAHCGSPTTGPSTAFHVLAREVADPRGGVLRVDDVRVGHAVLLGLCGECEAVGDLAARLLADSPWTARRIGSPAAHQVTAALDALRVIGAPLPERTSGDGLDELLDLAPLGASARWSAQFAPVWRLGSNDKYAASEPWLFVGLQLRAEIRTAYARWLARRRPARPVECPSGGCLLCGVGSVMARHGDTPWRATTANGSVLGGGAGSVHGHLCPRCQTAQDEAGSHMLDAAIIYVIDPDRTIRRMRPYPPSVNGARAWGVTSRKPNRTPFAHLSLDALRESFLLGDW